MEYIEINYWRLCVEPDNVAHVHNFNNIDSKWTKINPYAESILFNMVIYQSVLFITIRTIFILKNRKSAIFLKYFDTRKNVITLRRILRPTLVSSMRVTNAFEFILRLVFCSFWGKLLQILSLRWKSYVLGTRLSLKFQLKSSTQIKKLGTAIINHGYKSYFPQRLE